MEVEYEIQLTDIAKVFVKHLHIVVDDLQGNKLVVGVINSHDKIEACIPFVHHLYVNFSFTRIEGLASISLTTGIEALTDIS